MSEEPGRVVIVGAGFAGVATARELAGSEWSVTVVDVNNFHTFQPLLYQVATAGLDPADVAFPVRAIFKKAPNVAFRHGAAVRCDLDRREVTLADGGTLFYDRLVVATGATATFFAIPGAEQYSRALYTLRDARAVRNAVLSLLEDADARPERYRDGAPSFVVIGGGPTGVEIAGALVELLDVMVRTDHLLIDRKRASVLLVDALPRLLSGFSESSGAYAEATLGSRGVEIMLSTPVASVEAGSVHFADGTSRVADVVIWAAGVTVNGTLASSLGDSGRGGRVVVDERCGLAGHPEVYVVGDAGAVPTGANPGEVAPQLAQVAIQSGRYVAKAILAGPAASEMAPFHYHDKGIMATIGRRSAVAELTGPGPLAGRRRLSGTLGWLAWLGLHLIYLIGGLNRVVVFLNWCWRYLGWSSGPRIIVTDSKEPPVPTSPS